MAQQVEMLAVEPDNLSLNPGAHSCPLISTEVLWHLHSAHTHVHAHTCVDTHTHVHVHMRTHHTSDINTEDWCLRDRGHWQMCPGSRPQLCPS